MDKLIITVAGVGAETTKDAQPGLPVTAAEIGADAARCREAGAAMYHLHVRDAEANRESAAFELLEQEAELLTRHPTGVGLDLPAWLDALEEEVEELAKRRSSSEIDPQSLMTIAIVPLSLKELSEQLAKARRQGRRLPHMK